MSGGKTYCGALIDVVDYAMRRVVSGEEVPAVKEGVPLLHWCMS